MILSTARKPDPFNAVHRGLLRLLWWWGIPRGQWVYTETRCGKKIFFSFFFSFFFLSLLATKLSPGANFYCLRCFSRQSILAAAVFSFLFEAIYYKLGRVHTTPQRLSYRRQFPYMMIFSVKKKRFKKTNAAVYPSIAQQKEVLRQTLPSVFSLSEKSYVGSSLSDLKLWNSGLLDLVCKLFTFESSSSSSSSS